MLIENIPGANYKAGRNIQIHKNEHKTINTFNNYKNKSCSSSNNNNSNNKISEVLVQQRLVIPSCCINLLVCTCRLSNHGQFELKKVNYTVREHTEHTKK